MNPDKSYVKELAPIENKLEGPTEINIQVTILKFPAIKTEELQFTVDFDLHLKWKDFRLEFYDLNECHILNILSTSHKDFIWTPKLSFSNGLGSVGTEVDEQASILILKESSALPEDLTMATESKIFKGEENQVYLKRKYYQDFFCEFELQNYPFDTQVFFLIHSSQT